MKIKTRVVIDRRGLDTLFSSLQQRGYVTFGPTVSDGAIVYDRISGTDDLPVGWTDEQAGGHYRLRRREDEALFGYVVGPHTWKRFLFPPAQRLFTVTREGRELEIGNTTDDHPDMAFIGVRSCEVHAIGIQSKVFTGGEYIDPQYQRRLERTFVVAVNCGEARGTCFCTSMNTGPEVEKDYDLALTELLTADRHEFLVEVGSERGAEVLADVTSRSAQDGDVQAHIDAITRAESQMGRFMETDDIVDLLARNHDSPIWDDIAERCMSCANCTMVCPTCFCSTMEDVTDLSGDNAERWRRWDSCFTSDFTYIAGGHVRGSAKSRYRQWITHKLSSWHEQFGSSGCVGCGRCITWCPVGIDITEEVARLRQMERADATPQAVGTSQS